MRRSFRHGNRLSRSTPRTRPAHMYLTRAGSRAGSPLRIGETSSFRLTEGLWPRRGLLPRMEDDRAAEIAATFRRIQRPLRWPMADFARTRIANRGFVGFRFSR